MKRIRVGMLLWGCWWVFLVGDHLLADELRADQLHVGESPRYPLRRFEFSQQEMGTEFRIVFYALDEQIANSAAEDAFSRVRDLNGKLSDYDANSESRRLGDGTALFAEAGVRVSDDFWKVLNAADRLSRDSDGAFDVTVGPLTKLWRRARRQQELPPTELMDEARRGVDYRRLELLGASHSVRIRAAKSLPAESMRFDFGGIAKGYAADAALEVLNRHGITSVLIDGGGDLRLGLAPPGQGGWKVAITAQRAAKPDTTLVLSDCGVATSGDTWQYLEMNGQRYSHIIDPRTGLGLTNRTAVTVVAADAMTADGLASAVSVLGIEAGARLLESLREREVERLAAAQLSEKQQTSVNPSTLSTLVSGRIVAFGPDGESPHDVRETSGFAELPRHASAVENENNALENGKS